VGGRYVVLYVVIAVSTGLNATTMSSTSGSM